MPRRPPKTLTKLEAKLASAKATLDGIDRRRRMLAITPADYNANKKWLQPYLQAVRYGAFRCEEGRQVGKAHRPACSSPAPTPTSTTARSQGRHVTV